MGKEQEVHKSDGLILKPYLTLFALSGLIIGFNIGFHLFSLAVILPLLVLILFVCPLRKRGKIGMITMGAALLIGFVLGIPKTKARTDYGIYEGIIIENRENYFLFDSGFHRYYVYERDCEREEGDFLAITGKATPLKMTSYEGYFSFESYLNKKGVDYELHAYETEVKFARPLRLASKENKFLKSFEEPTRGLLSSVLFGAKDYSNDTVALAASMNALAFLSVSGMILSFFLRFLDWFFRLGFNDKTSDIIVFIIATLLFPFGIHKIGFWRVYLGRASALASTISGKTTTPLTRTSVIGIALFLLNPWNALQSGYLIGFGLSIFMMLTAGHRVRYKRRDRKAIDTIYLLVFLAPLFIKGNAFHVMGPLYSAMLIPLVGPFAALGYLSFFSLPFVTVLNLYSSFLNGTLQFLENFDLVVTVGQFNDLTIFIYYYALAIFFIIMDQGKTILAQLVPLAGVVAFIINVCPLVNYASNQVTFLNVGQGDCIFIRNQNKTVLIDTGGNTSFDMAKEVDIPFLRGQRVSKLDYVIITHGDADHSGALESLKKNYNVKHIIRDKSSFPLTIGDLRFINYNENDRDTKEENNNSLVLSLEFMNKKWLFMGDAPEALERQIIKEHPDLDCDILKAGHHGSDTSSCEEFLKCVTPEVAILSVGKKNSYGHPSDKVLARFDRLGIKVRRTDVEGSITYRQNLLFSGN